MIVLGIETSCDETAAAIVTGAGAASTILSNRIASQVEIHARYGGIVPEVASRQHTLAIVPVIAGAMTDAGIGWDRIDGIAVTIGPGLAGSLLTGVNTAKAISLARDLPLTGVNHLEGHIYASWLTGDRPVFPLLCLIVSGGHTDLVLMKGHGDYTRIGGTRDDAAGEAFDKAARMLGLGYPGGPAIQKAAAAAVTPINLPRAWLKGTNDFSFSGLKTALLRLVESGEVASPATDAGMAPPDVPGGAATSADAAAGFQEAVVDVLVTKTVAAAAEYRARQIILAGGVAANRPLRERLVAVSPLPVVIPEPALCTDNAAMIAACGCRRFESGQVDGLDIDVLPGLRLAGGH